MNPAHVLCCLLFASTLAACGGPTTPTLSLPYALSLEGNDATADVWVFGPTTEGEPRVRAFQTGLRRAEWRPNEARTPVGARELRVVLTRADGEFELEGSNEIRFLGSSLRPSVSGPPQAVPWRSGSDTILVVGTLLSRVSLLTPSGEPLPGERFVCVPAPEEMLESSVTRCTVREATPLSGAENLRSVRARVEDLGEVWVLPEVALP
ncbi:MAG: hypothetical protein Q8S33_16500 [Myxococcales bacterium]|nr:hypothetical protein [Myxococcales bacterium]